jgi:hypothetical protein
MPNGGISVSTRLKNVLVFICSLLTVFLLTVSLAQAQQPKKVSRIGYLSNNDPASELARAEAIRQALRERGYIGLYRRTEHRRRVPICGGKARSVCCACGRAGTSQG